MCCPYKKNIARTSANTRRSVVSVWLYNFTAHRGKGQLVIQVAIIGSRGVVIKPYPWSELPTCPNLIVP